MEEETAADKGRRILYSLSKLIRYSPVVVRGGPDSFVTGSPGDTSRVYFPMRQLALYFPKKIETNGDSSENGHFYRFLKLKRGKEKTQLKIETN